MVVPVQRIGIRSVAVMLVAATLALTGCSATSTTSTIAISIADGKVDPSGERVEVTKDQLVTLQVTSDAATTLHVHGYTEFEVPKGGPTSFEFAADKVGAWEIETHDPAMIVVTLVVR